MCLLYDWVWAFLCDSGGKTRTKDKYRVVYTDQQRLELEREFQHNRYITMRRKTELSVELGLSERQVGGLQSKLNLGVERERGGEIRGSRGRVTMQESRWQSQGDDWKGQERMWRKNQPQTQQRLRCLIMMRSVAVVSAVRPRFGSNPSPIHSNSVYNHENKVFYTARVVFLWSQAIMVNPQTPSAETDNEMQLKAPVKASKWKLDLV